MRYFAGADRLDAARIERHVDGCSECRRMFALLARTSLGAPPPPANATDDDEAVPLGDHLPEGAVVGRYRVRRVLGRGGMGVVYEAYDPKLLRFVALKVLRADIAAHAGERLRREAQAMARLSHPNVCPVFDVGAVHGRHYLAMACIRRGTLVDWLQERPRGVREIGEMFVAAGRGLAAAHAIGVVHRDFKPANVLVDAEERVLVCDFGLAATDHQLDSPQGGTPRYMAPEQRAGSGDARVDQYAFAVACSDALAELPVKRRVRSVLQRAQAPDPNDRFPDMEGLLRALSSSLPTPRRLDRRVLLGIAVVGIGGLAAISLASAPPVPPATEAPPEVPEVYATVDALLDLSREYERADEPHAAIVVLDIAVQEAMARQGPADIAIALAARGSMLARVGRLLEAAEQLEDAFLRGRQIGRDDIAAEAAIILLGLLARDLDRPQEALDWGRHVEGTLERLEWLDPPLVAAFDHTMGLAHIAAGELELGRARLLRGVAHLREHSPTHDEHLPGPLNALAGLAGRMEEHDDAVKYAEEAYALARRIYGPEHPETGSVLGQLAFARQGSGDTEGALDALQRGRSILAATYGLSHPNTLSIDGSLASMLIAEGRYEEALAAMDDALARTPSHLPIRCALQERAGASLLFLERCAEARPRLRDAIDCYASFGNDETPQAARAQRQLARCAEPADD